MKNIAMPSIDFSISFKPEQKELCEACYHDVMNLYKEMYEKDSQLYAHFDNDGIDYCSDGWYFTIYITLSETELIRKIMEIILKYGAQKC